LPRQSFRSVKRCWQLVIALAATISGFAQAPKAEKTFTDITQESGVVAAIEEH